MPSNEPRVTAADLPLPKREVTFRSADGVELHGWLWRSREPTSPAVVCVHQLGGDRREWEPLVGDLRARGAVSVLAIDLRGHGQSTRQGEKTLSYRTFSEGDWRGVVEDVRAALAYLQEGSGLRPSKVAVVGSSIGSSAALRAAADDATVVAVVAISPGLAYHGLDTREAARQLGGRPLLLVATRGDTGASQAVDTLARDAGRSDRQVYAEGRAHGVAIASESPDLFPRISVWLGAKLGITR